MTAVGASKGFPRAGKIRIPIVIFNAKPTLAAGVTHLLFGTTTTAQNQPFGFPFRLVAMYATFPAMTATATVNIRAFKNTDSVTNDVVLTTGVITGAAGPVDNSVAVTTPADVTAGLQGADVFSATDNLVVHAVVGVTDLLSGMTVWVVIEPGEAGN